MKFHKLLLMGGVSVLSIPVAMPSHCGLWMQQARADIYHATERDDTLAKVATRFGVSASALRSLNKLKGTSDDAVLPSMLLRVPDTKETGTVKGIATLDTSSSMNFAPAAREDADQSEAATKGAGGCGTVARSMLYTVAPGDTWESIAQSQSRDGYNVSADAIRRKNDVPGELSPGIRLVIPLQSATYRAPQSSVTTFASKASNGSRSKGKATRIGGEVEVSDEIWMPSVQEIARKKPVYRAPNALPAPGRQGRRGPSDLSSRGYFPDPTLEGARVLGQDEEAPNVAAPPSARSRQAAAPRETLSPMARVAQVSTRGARIRRLPEASAVTLYSCARGTELAVTRRSGSWSAILMSDGSTGWVPSRYLRFTGASYDVSSKIVTEAIQRRRAQSGRTARRLAVAGQFSSDNPMVAQALGWLGTPYVYGGTGRRGIDCSSLVQHSFKACGYRLPRTAAEQAKIGTAVATADLQAGDRLYFSASGHRIDHTGLYMGNGLFVHASGSGRSVIVSRLSDRRNWNIYVGARR